MSVRDYIVKIGKMEGEIEARKMAEE